MANTKSESERLRGLQRKTRNREQKTELYMDKNIRIQKSEKE